MTTYGKGHNDTKRFNKLKKGEANFLCPPRVQSLLCGAIHAEQVKDGTITLVYYDGVKESRPSEKDLCTEFDSFFDVVSYVQEARHAHS